ncbi:uncharacterized protein [Amphiura filiformis]|uniref:uncharacterized protein isoform X2 n=1 Tax=Amphiura filiformis TaxID=82378 RepID=UPI003B20D946
MAATIEKSHAEREDDKIQSFNVEFDKPNDTVYRPGDSVQGYVKVVIRPNSDPIEHIRKLQIKCRGKCRTEWKEQEGSGEDQRTVWYGNAEKYFEEKLVVMGTDIEGKSHLEEGEHRFPFTFDIPIDKILPPSYESKYGHVRYQVRVKIDKPGYVFDQTTRRCFILEPGLNLNTEPDMVAPSKSEDEKTVCCLCCATGPIKASAQTDKSGYVPGETILVVHYYMYSESDYHHISNKTEKKVMSEQIKDGCEENSRASFEGLLLVPCCPPLLKGCKFIDLEYYVEVEADVSGTPFDLELKLPITIGTVPLYSAYYSTAFPPGEVISQQPTTSQPSLPVPGYEFPFGDIGSRNVIYGKHCKNYRYGALFFAPRYAYYTFTTNKDAAYPIQQDAPNLTQPKEVYPPNAVGSYGAYPPTDAIVTPSAGGLYPPNIIGVYRPTDANVPPSTTELYPPVIDAACPPNYKGTFPQSVKSVMPSAEGTAPQTGETNPQPAAAEPVANIQRAPGEPVPSASRYLNPSYETAYPTNKGIELHSVKVTNLPPDSEGVTLQSQGDQSYPIIDQESTPYPADDAGFHHSEETVLSSSEGIDYPCKDDVSPPNVPK